MTYKRGWKDQLKRLREEGELCKQSLKKTTILVGRMLQTFPDI